MVNNLHVINDYSLKKEHSHYTKVSQKNNLDGLCNDLRRIF